MGRTLQDSLDWAATGTKLFGSALDGLTEEAAAAPSALPAWSRKHLLAHVAANADAVGNLVHWAATGERTPMYASPEQRAADIDAGSVRPLDELVAWWETSAGRLAGAMAALTPDQWQVEVVTAQGRTVPAAETPWMRAREVLVHAVDLCTGVTFADLPERFLAVLADEIAAKRSAGGNPALELATDAGHRWTVSGEGQPVAVSGTLAAVTAYLAGRSSPDVSAADGGPAPALPTWL